MTSTIEHPAVDLLIDEIERRGWCCMVSEYPASGKPALAFVGNPETDVSFDAVSEHALSALSMAYTKMRTHERRPR